MKRRDFLAAALPWGLASCSHAPAITGGFVGAAVERGHLLQRKSGTFPVPTATFKTRVLIAGGGVAGLAAARALRLRGIDDMALLELEDAAGGNSRGGAVSGIACPLGAHYLPVPGEHARDVQHLLEELGVRQRVAGRWAYDERMLCHSPQERLFMGVAGPMSDNAAPGEWQDGLLPQPGMAGVDASAMGDYQRFAQQVRAASQTGFFTIPVSNSPVAQNLLAWDAMTFEAWLNQHQLHSPALRWYLDYCCRDDYGAGISAVSAWAGLHYFASRHGFSAPGGDALLEKDKDKDAGVLTWPEGNGWLTARMAAPLGERLHTGRVVLRVEAGKHGVAVDALNTATSRFERWQADHCILALPMFVAARVVQNPPAALLLAAQSLRYAPWLVANVHLRTSLLDRPGAAPSWDNVVYTPGATNVTIATSGQSLGYVDARHQSLDRVPDATVLTHYRAFGIDPAQRQQLYEQPWTHWRDTVLAELSLPHPDLPGKVSRIDVMRYGHAMSVPVPGTRANAALRALQQSVERLQFAHSDLSGYSVFEEAFTHGTRAGRAVPM
jgi:predicted NAD/FAD-binding protein